MTRVFPLAAAALHPDWPQATFNVPGMFSHHPLVIQFFNVVKIAHDCRVPIEATHGAPATHWNAGRVADAAFDQKAFETMLESFAVRGAGYFPTFTNHLIQERDLDDPVGNAVLECLNRQSGLHAVIVTSDLLSSHIAKTYPRLRQIASLTKVTHDGGAGKPEYYRELGQRFHRFVVDPDDSRDQKLMDQLDRAKAEIMVNENCVEDCPQRARHYDAYARLQRAQTPAEQERVRQEINQIIGACGSPLHPDRLGERRLSCNLSRSEVKALYAMGFRHFKLQGRRDDPFSVAYDLTRFLLEPEIVAPHIHKTLCRWLKDVWVRTRS